MLYRLFIIIALATVLTGCDAIQSFFSSADDSSAIVSDTPPTLTLTDSSFEMDLGTYCWTSTDVGLCVDTIPPAYETSEHIIISADVLRLAFATPMPDRISAYVHPGSNLMTRIADIQLEPTLQDDGTLTIPVLDNLSGEYVLVVTAFWEDYGDAFYSLPITIE